MVSNKKVQVHLGDKALGRIEELKKEADGASISDIVRSALSLYSWAATEVGNGSRVGAVTRDGEFKEVVILELSMNRADRCGTVAASLGATGRQSDEHPRMERSSGAKRAGAPVR